MDSEGRSSMESEGGNSDFEGRSSGSEERNSESDGQSSDSEGETPNHMQDTAASSQSDVEARAPSPPPKKTTKKPLKTAKPTQNSDTESDIEIRSNLAKKKPKLIKTNTYEELLVEKPVAKEKKPIKKPVAKEKKLIKKALLKEKENKNQNPKKMTTKEMVQQAMGFLNSRKGVSVYAIKKYVVANFSVDQNKIGFYIKKYIKNSIETGELIQMKGIGVSGSFKLPPKSKKPEKKVKKTEESEVKKPEKTEMEKVKPKLKGKSLNDATQTKKIMKEKSKKKMAKTTKPSPIKTIKEKAKKKDQKAALKKETKKSEDEKKTIKKLTKETKIESNKNSGNLAKRVAKEIKKSKRKSIVRRKSIGSLVKPPKMKPKSRV